MLLDGFIKLLTNNLFTIFFIFCLFLLLYGGYLYIQSIILLNYWYPKLETENAKEDTITEEELDDLEDEASKDHFMALIFNRIREISRKVKELNVNEIKELVDEQIYKHENDLMGVANAFIILGVLFTVLGLYTGLVGLEDYSAKNVGLLLGQLRIAFISTIVGILGSGTILLLVKFTISPRREKFSYNLILFAKNILIPKYGTPDAEKDLGVIVKSISTASKKLEQAANSVQNMAEDSQVGTKQIQNAVRGFKKILSQMIEREDQITSQFNEVANRLTDLKAEFKDSIKPSIDLLQKNIDDRDASIKGHFNTLLSVQDKQSQINTDIRSSMEKVTLILSDLSEFFNRDFEGSFKDAVETINQRYKHRFDEIFTSIQDMNEKIKSGVSTDQMNSMVNHLKEEITSVSADIGDRLATMDEKETTKFELLQDHVNNLNTMSADFNDEISSLVQSITDYKNNVENLSKDINGLNKRMEDFQISDIQKLDSVDGDLRRVSDLLIKLADNQADIAREMRRIKPNSPQESRILSGIKSFFSDSDK